MSSPFTPKTLSFLRALKRNNDREWFRARKDDYERHVRGPMVQLITRLAADLKPFAPELVADPKRSLYRIYRDTRFSDDKTPLKTNAAAVFPPRGFPRHEGAGLYVEIAPGWVWMGGGLYMPPSTALYAIRERIATTHPRLHRLVTAREFQAVLGELQGDRLTRVPRGYLKDHPAGEYLRFKQFLGFREFEPAFATSDRFYPELLRTFKALTPLLRFLNGAIRDGAIPAPVLVHGPGPDGRASLARRHAP
jgi:uncharacterized protein (TIGR02453 family)